MTLIDLFGSWEELTLWWLAGCKVLFLVVQAVCEWRRAGGGDGWASIAER